MPIHSRHVWMLILITAVFALTGCSQTSAPKPAPPYKPLATLEEVMHSMVIPHAQTVWKSTGTIMTLKGTEEIKPKTEDDWLNVEASATTIMEAGNLLMMEGRAKDSGKWMERCRALVDGGNGVRLAAKAHDAEGLFTRGGDLFEACQGCHFEYRYTRDAGTIRSH